MKKTLQAGKTHAQQPLYSARKIIKSGAKEAQERFVKAWTAAMRRKASR